MSGPQDPAPYRPPAVQFALDEIWEVTGYQAQAEQLTNGRWRVTLDTGRIHVTYDQKQTRSGRFVQCGSTLTIDGQSREIADDIYELARIIRDPDGLAPPELMELPPMPVERPIGEAPARIQGLYKTIIEHIGREAPGEDFDLRIGRRGGRWTIGLDQGRTALRLIFGRGPSDKPLRIELVINGVDHSAEIGNSIEEAMAHFGTDDEDTTGPPQTIGQPKSGARSNAVETRKSTVIRT